MRGRLDEEFADRWIGRGGPTAWPPRSPDVTPCDFFLWGFGKDRVSENPVRNMTELKLRTSDVVKMVNQNMLSNILREILCWQTWLKDNESKYYEAYK